MSIVMITRRRVDAIERNSREPDAEYDVNPLRDAALRQIRRSESWIMTLLEHTGEALIGGAEITSDVILAPEIEMPRESDKVERIDIDASTTLPHLRQDTRA